MDEIYNSNIEHKSVLTLYSEYKNGQINLDVHYQRDVVWNIKKQQAFINSVFANIIPIPLIFNVNTDSGELTCIDGKQRVTSIINFILNKFTFEWNSEEKCYADLELSEKTKFNNRSIVIIKYIDLDNESQLDVFNRIQNSVKLSKGDLIVSSIANNTVSKLYKEFIARHKINFSKYIKTDKLANGHCVLLTDLLCSLYYNKICTKKKNRMELLQEHNTAKKFKDLLKKYEPAIEIFFSEKLFLNKVFTKDIINKITIHMIIYTVLFCSTKYDLKPKYPLDDVREMIIGSIKEYLKIKNRNIMNYQMILDSNYSNDIDDVDDLPIKPEDEI